MTRVGPGSLVVIESPFAGDVESNTAYARAALKDCLTRGEYPIASHLLYTQPGVLDDLDPEDRELGIDAGLAWGKLADQTFVYLDQGVSKGMRAGIARAIADGRPVAYRRIPGWERYFGRDDMGAIAKGDTIESMYHGLVVLGVADHTHNGAWFTADGGALVMPRENARWRFAPAGE
jgi:hypothetical protein